MSKTEEILKRADVIDRIRKKFTYKDGQLYNAIRGTPCETICSGYKVGSISVENKTYNIGAHRIIFFLHYGYFPKLIDHINRDKNDNRIENLREVTRSENFMNSCKRYNESNSSRHRGVSYSKNIKKWWCRIYINLQRFDLGYFDDEDTAAIAYNRAAKKHYGENVVFNDIADDGREIVYNKRIPKSKYKGLTIDANGRIEVYIHVNGKKTYIGSYRQELEAAKAYNKACIDYGVPHKMNKIEE